VQIREQDKAARELETKAVDIDAAGYILLPAVLAVMLSNLRRCAVVTGVD
jgi:hypothetical protein